MIIPNGFYRPGEIKPDFRCDPRYLDLKIKYWDQYKKQIDIKSNEYNLYHDNGNWDRIIYAVLLTPVALIFGSSNSAIAVLWAIAIWAGFLLANWTRDETLERDPEIQRQRANAFKRWLQKNGYVKDPVVYPMPKNENRNISDEK